MVGKMENTFRLLFSGLVATVPKRPPGAATPPDEVLMAVPNLRLPSPIRVGSRKNPDLVVTPPPHVACLVVERRYVEELGGMNVFFVFEDGSLLTPPLGTILPGITRDSIIALARDAGTPVREEPYTIDQWRADAASGKLKEAFACGTAAVISPIGKVCSTSGDFLISGGAAGPMAMGLRKKLVDIQYGRAPDPHEWIRKVM